MRSYYVQCTTGRKQWRQSFIQFRIFVLF
jgi:hypothetical protein